jgi:hypothetical protein
MRAAHHIKRRRGALVFVLGEALSEDFMRAREAILDFLKSLKRGAFSRVAKLI